MLRLWWKSARWVPVAPFRGHPFFHANDRERFPVLQRDITPGLVEQDSGQGCTHFETTEARSNGGTFTSLQDHATDTAAHPTGMNEAGANLCGVVLGIQQGVFKS